MEVFVVVISAEHCDPIVEIFSTEDNAKDFIVAHCEYHWDAEWGNFFKLDYKDTIDVFQEEMVCRIEIVKRVIDKDSGVYAV